METDNTQINVQPRDAPLELFAHDRPSSTLQEDNNNKEESICSSAVAIAEGWQ